MLKTAKRFLCIIAFSAILIGCGEETPDFVGVHADADPHDIDAYYHWWDIAAINGKKMNIRPGSVYFSGTGEFTHVFKASSLNCKSVLRHGDHSRIYLHQPWALHDAPQ